MRALGGPRNFRGGQVRHASSSRGGRHGCGRAVGDRHDFRFSYEKRAEYSVECTWETNRKIHSVNKKTKVNVNGRRVRGSQEQAAERHRLHLGSSADEVESASAPVVGGGLPERQRRHRRRSERRRSHEVREGPALSPCARRYLTRHPVVLGGHPRPSRSLAAYGGAVQEGT